MVARGVGVSLAILLVAACGDSAQDRGVGAPVSTIEVPMGVRLKTLPSCETDLTATVIVDGGTSSPLNVNCQAGTVSGTIPGLSPGSHRFELQFTFRGVVVATAATNGDITSGQNTSIAFAPGALSFPDLDDDGWTNLAELIAGSDHQLWSSFPPSSNRRASVTYALTDSVGAPIAGAPGGNGSSTPNTLIVHAPVAGAASSARYVDIPSHVPPNR